jgi:hypothetical protein
VQSTKFPTKHFVRAVIATEDVRNYILECNVMLGLDKFLDYLLVAMFIEYAMKEALKESKRLYY